MKTEEHILETAFRLFLKKGFSDISINEVIREAETTKGGFYYCFKSRENLVAKVIEKYLKPYYVCPIAKMQEVWAKKQDDVSTKTLLWEVFFAPRDDLYISKKKLIWKLLFVIFIFYYMKV